LKYSWVVAVDDVSKIEKSLLSVVVVVCRTNLDRKYLEWKQIGAPETLEDMQPPFFVEGLSRHHTSKAGKVIAKIVKAKNFEDDSRNVQWLDSEVQ
jgi:hypothetical protein